MQDVEYGWASFSAQGLLIFQGGMKKLDCNTVFSGVGQWIKT